MRRLRPRPDTAAQVTPVRARVSTACRWLESAQAVARQLRRIAGARAVERLAARRQPVAVGPGVAAAHRMLAHRVPVEQARRVVSVPQARVVYPARRVSEEPQVERAPAARQAEPVPRAQRVELVLREAPAMAVRAARAKRRRAPTAAHCSSDRAARPTALVAVRRRCLVAADR